jgi:hypothetical protein
MCYSTVLSMLLLMAAQVQAEKASEAGGALAASQIRLNAREKTLAEIVDGINAQGPEMLAVFREPHDLPQAAKPISREARYSFGERGPVTFWEAVDRIGSATQTFPISGNMPSHKLGVILKPASVKRGFACNDGAFRVMVTGTHYTSNFWFSPIFYNQPGIEQPKTDGSSRRPILAAALLIMAEPRIRIVRPVELVVREALDDRGRNLIPAVPWRQSLSQGPARSFPNQEFVPVPLKPMDDAGERIKHVAGSVIIEAADGRAGAPGALVKIRFDFADVPLP